MYFGESFFGGAYVFSAYSILLYMVCLVHRQVRTASSSYSLVLMCVHVCSTFGVHMYI